MDENRDAGRATDAGKHSHGRLWTFCAMLALALVGMGFTMSTEHGAWEFWLLLLAFYGGVSVFWSWQRAKQSQQPVWRIVRAEVFHWSCVLIVYAILILFERTEIINRQAAANVALLVLALACLLAGIHFERTFLLVGIVLMVMVLAVGYLEQYSVWFMMLPVVIAAAWIFFQIRKRGTSGQS